MESEDMINSSVNCRKISKEVTNGEIKDRISSLPNEILGHILSFLPTKYAVGTCILSTRWKYLWTSLCNLDFDDWLLFGSDRPTSRREMTLNFTIIVHRVLTLCKMSYIQRFRLKCGQNYESSHVNAWIYAALWRNVQELDLCTSMEDPRVLPRDLFSCGTLVSLKLDAEFVLDVPSSVSLPKLKTLHLKKVQFLDDDSARMLFSSCPVLEELLILECDCENISVFNISGLALKRLIICDCIYKEDFEYKVIIDAPVLEYLKLTAKLVEGSSVKNVESLLQAYLHIDILFQHNYSLFELIKAIFNVKVLRLSGDTMEDFPSSHQELPVFPNLTRLELDVNMDVDIGLQYLLQDLLQNSPNLESLFFCSGDVEEFQWTLFEQVPHCLLHCLKTIKMMNFRGLKEELKLVKYFLKNAEVLNKLNIIGTRSYYRRMTKEEELNVSKKLLMFPKRSKTCQVVLLS